MEAVPVNCTPSPGALPVTVLSLWFTAQMAPEASAPRLPMVMVPERAATEHPVTVP